MKIPVDTFGLLVIAWIVLDVVSAKRPSWKFDVIYAALFLVLGVATVLSDDRYSLLIGSIAIGVAFAWGGWVLLRESSASRTLQKASISGRPPGSAGEAA
jgi:hypothetical protein